MKVRQDAWLEENDEQLAEAVIRHVREGSTQLNAFEEASDLLNRTAAACGFRWNAVVRKKYSEQLAAAKQERKEKFRVMQATKKRAPSFYYSTPIEGNNQTPVALSSLSIDTVIAYLYKLQYQMNDQNSTKWRLIATKANEKVKQLETEIEKLKNENKSIKQDYEQFVQIMNRARKMVAFQDEELPNPTFTMERNGNLVVSKISEEN